MRYLFMRQLRNLFSFSWQDMENVNVEVLECRVGLVEEANLTTNTWIHITKR